MYAQLLLPWCRCNILLQSFTAELAHCPPSIHHLLQQLQHDLHITHALPATDEEARPTVSVKAASSKQKKRKPGQLGSSKESLASSKVMLGHTWRIPLVMHLP